MSLRAKYTYWRHQRCIRLGHPMASWSRWVISMKDYDWRDPETGEMTHGDEYRTIAWECSIHDTPPTKEK